MRLLLVEDDPKICKFLTNVLTQSGYSVSATSNGRIALGRMRSDSHDLIICDIMLPELDGLQLIEEFRKHDGRTPVLILSAKRSVDDRIIGLKKGGDDYLVKPFSSSELLARVEALLRRTRVNNFTDGTNISTKLESFGVHMNLVTREVFRDGRKIDLQTKEFALLEYFLRSSGKVLTKSQILERIWNYHFDPQTNVVDVLVFRLRNKIDRGFEKKLVQNIRGVGYVFQPT